MPRYSRRLQGVHQLGLFYLHPHVCQHLEHGAHLLLRVPAGEGGGGCQQEIVQVGPQRLEGAALSGARPGWHVAQAVALQNADQLPGPCLLDAGRLALAEDTIAPPEGAWPLRLLRAELVCVGVCQGPVMKGIGEVNLPEPRAGRHAGNHVQHRIILTTERRQGGVEARG